jgi:DNA-binding XRE family transcriptional regulator
MPVTLDEILNEMPAERRATVLQRAQEIREEINLRELRRARKLTQTRLSKKLKIGQEGISRIERRSDMNLSTLQNYVEGVGGKLKIIVEFPDQPPVILAALGTDDRSKKAKKKTGNGAKSKAKTGRAA